MNIIRTETPGELVAEIVSNRLRAFPDLQLALPTGKTPNSMYRHLRSLNLNARRASLFQLDEYLGPNRGDMRSELAKQTAGIAFNRFCPWDTEREVLPGAPYALDLAVLGLGLNGHVAFVEPEFPNSDFYKGKLSSSTSIQNSVPEQDVLTMGMSYILRAREVVLLVRGKQKAEILAQALQGPRSKDLPASFLQDHGRLLVVCDPEAASGLQGLRQRSRRAVVAIGCKGIDGLYSPASRGRVFRAARLAASADLLLISGGKITGRNTEAEQMMRDLLSVRQTDTPLLLEEASLRSAHHVFLTDPLLRAAGIEETTFVTSWWHLPRFWFQNHWSGARFKPAWSLRGIWGQRRFRDEAEGILWARADSSEARGELVATEKEEWTIKGYGDLASLSGQYNLQEARAAVAIGAERAPSVFDFDQLLSGYTPDGHLLSGSQLLEALHAARPL